MNNLFYQTAQPINRTTRTSVLIKSILILLFCYAAISKLLVFPEFRGQLHNQNIPAGMADVALYLIPGSELLICILLLAPGTQWYGLTLSLLALTIFTGYIGLVLFHFWPRRPCSCGGIISHLSWKAHFLFNWVFLLLAVWALLTERPPSHFKKIFRRSR